MNEVKVVRLVDVDRIVKIHKQSFKDFFLTNLGPSFLKAYYKVLINSKESIVVGFFANNQLEGFCAVAKLSRGFNFNLIKANLWFFFIQGVKILFTKPFAILRLIKNLNKTDSNVNDSGNYSEVLSIAISTNMQGKGGGKKMLYEIEEKIKSRRNI
ncbi:MAG TPA: GNAT family N-acetyltransferase [Tenacibaculum sp.]|nr:GNAT family N-acetyltransferase [Tenacibaculum sp.]